MSNKIYTCPHLLEGLGKCYGDISSYCGETYTVTGHILVWISIFFNYFSL